MYCLPVPDARSTTELIVGSKGGSGEIGLLKAPRDGDRRDLGRWTWQTLAQAGWIMSIRSRDMDGDGFTDIVYSDRRTTTRGIHWLRRPSETDSGWQRFTAGGQDREVMFMDIGDLNDDGRTDIVSAARNADLLVLTGGRTHDEWTAVSIPYPPNVGTGKGVAIGDINGDHVMDLVCSCEHAENKTGVFWLSRSTPTDDRWSFHDVSGTEQGVKFDRLELQDLDDDGDLDILTCEERDNLGVIWYENPHRSRADPVQP